MPSGLALMLASYYASLLSSSRPECFFFRFKKCILGADHVHFHGKISVCMYVSFQHVPRSKRQERVQRKICYLLVVHAWMFGYIFMHVVVVSWKEPGVKAMVEETEKQRCHIFCICVLYASLFIILYTYSWLVFELRNSG